VVTTKAVDVDDANACTTDVCDPKTGNVTHEPKPVSDGNPCTIDTCDPASGVAHTAKGDACVGCLSAADCNDDLPCTADVCNANGKCEHPSASAEIACGKETDCQNASRCDGKGACKAGEPKKIADDDPCTNDRCVGGVVVHEPPAPSPDKCLVISCDPSTGVTTSRSKADDGTACTDDTCDPATGLVTHKEIPGIPDNDPCTKDACDPKTGEISHNTTIGCTGCASSEDCDDKSACTLDTCNAGLCAHTNVPAGTSCGNGSVCDGDELCDDKGQCLPGAVPVVNDGDACTVDSCVEPVGVQHTPEPLDDGNPCTKDACDLQNGVTHTAIMGCAACDSDLQCGNIAVGGCVERKCQDKVCVEVPKSAGVACGALVSDCTTCDGAGQCTKGGGGTPAECNGRCGNVTSTCGGFLMCSCEAGFVCDKQSLMCVPEQN
jgi:hypothetical protein